jgi:hypothetical protein
MMHLIKILFLGISVFFSFGFTTYQSKCGKQEIKIEENAHSCCHPKNKSECTQSKDCKADCCLQTSEFFVFNHFVIGNEKVEKFTVLESIKNIDKGFYTALFSDVESKVIINNYEYLNLKKSGRYLISLKQSWLI